jgi:prepilin-type N-terminal cleavage/methylation domain-containing protein
MKREKGFTLIEVMISMVIISTLAVGVLSALGTTSLTLLKTDLRETAKNLAESQMEYVKNLPYSGSYTAATIPSEYAEFTASIQSTALLASNIERITVTISQGSNTIYTLEGYKVQ